MNSQCKSLIPPLHAVADALTQEEPLHTSFRLSVLVPRHLRVNAVNTSAASRRCVVEPGVPAIAAGDEYFLLFFSSRQLRFLLWRRGELTFGLSTGHLYIESPNNTSGGYGSESIRRYVGQVCEAI